MNHNDKRTRSQKRLGREHGNPNNLSPVVLNNVELNPLTNAGDDLFEEIKETCNSWGTSVFNEQFNLAGYDTVRLNAIVETIESKLREFKNYKVVITSESMYSGVIRDDVFQRIRNAESILKDHRSKVNKRRGRIKYNKRQLNLLMHEKNVSHQHGLSDAFMVVAERLLDSEVYESLKVEAQEVLFTVSGKATNSVKKTKFDENDSIGNV